MCRWGEGKGSDNRREGMHAAWNEVLVGVEFWANPFSVRWWEVLRLEGGGGGGGGAGGNSYLRQSLTQAIRRSQRTGVPLPSLVREPLSPKAA